MIKQRYQNPVLGDTITLQNLVYSSNSLSNAYEVQKVEVYFLDPDLKSEENPDGRILITTTLPADISNPSVGVYEVSLQTNETDYRVGNYIDRWSILFEQDDPRVGIVEHDFKIYRDLWYNAPIPLVYNIGFNYEPHKIVSGTKKYLRVDLEVFTPDKTSMEKYYYFLETLAEIHVRMAQDEGPDYDPNVPEKNVVFNWRPVTFRERTTGYYLLDTTVDPRPHMNGDPMPDGIYLLQFKASVGETIHLSPQYRLQLFS